MYTTGACLLALFAIAAAATLHLEKPVEANLFLNSRIINGEAASPGEFPHQITLLNNGYHMCGGSVISNGWVLTAANCVDGQTTSSLAVVVNLHDFSNPGNYIWFDIASINMHPEYNKGLGGFPNNVAVLRLVQTNTYDISRNAISLASGSNLFENQQCIISGWGVTESGFGSSVLFKSSVRVYPNSECSSAWGSSNILSQHICVRGEATNGSGACTGDSGGPLVCAGQLAGVASWGRSGCHVNGEVTHPSVYARVTYFYSWIQSICNCV